MLFTVVKRGKDQEREIVTEGAIIDVAELVHTKNSHAG